MFVESEVSKVLAQTDHTKLERTVNRSRRIALVTFIVVLSAYAVQFVILPFAISQGVWAPNWTIGSGDQEIWGQFGDFVGGFLNPLIAAFALFWLTQSVRLQSIEMAATRKALEESAQAQRDQVALTRAQAIDQTEHSNRITRINALNVVVVSFTADINSVRGNVDTVSEPFRAGTRRFNDLWGNALTEEDARKLLSRLKAGLEQLLRERQKCIDELNALREEIAKAIP